MAGVPLTRIPYLVASSGLSIALWQVKDKHGSYSRPGSSMTRPKSQTRVVNVWALQGVQLVSRGQPLPVQAMGGSGVMPSQSSCKTALWMRGLKKPKNTSRPHVWLSTRKRSIIIARLMETTEDSLDSQSQANPGPESICSSCVVLNTTVPRQRRILRSGSTKHVIPTEWNLSGVVLVLSFPKIVSRHLKLFRPSLQW